VASATGPGAARPSMFARLSQEHARVFFFSLGKLGAQPLGTLLTAAVIGITLALPAGLHVLLRNVSAVSASWESTLQVSLFLKDSTSRARGEALAAELGGRPGVVKTEYVSREQALAEFRELSGFGEALDLLSENPLPALVLVTPQRELGQAQINALVESLARLPEVEQAKLDQKWLERLYALLEIARRLVWMIAGLLGLAVIVVVGNTIRLDIENRREEIEVMKLIGAPDGFIRRPFLYSGFWYGLLGGVLGFIFVWAALLSIIGPTRQLALLYQSGFTLSGLSFSGTVAMLAAGIALGWLGAFWTVARHLSRIEPR
jgi:cell division transport system permease protein